MAKYFKTLSCTVTGPEGALQFKVRAFRSEAPAERNMEAEFYGKFMPKGVHFELELLEPEILWSEEQTGSFHIHVVKATGARYVCWTGEIFGIEQAKTLLQIWSVGTVYTMVTGKDFGSVFAACGGEAGVFLFQMKEAGFIVGEVTMVQ